MAFLEIEIESTHRTKSGQRYKVFHGGDILLDSTKDPEFDAGRELYAIGADIGDIVMIFHRGDPMLRMSGSIGSFITKRTSEGDASGPRLSAWSPYFGPDDADD